MIAIYVGFGRLVVLRPRQMIGKFLVYRGRFKDNMIKCHLSRFMGERKLKISDLSRATGLHRNTLTLLYDETATRIDLDTINILCRYFHCQVGELFEYLEADS